MADFNEQRDSDADFRHRPPTPGAGRPIAEANPNPGQGISVNAWANPGPSDILKGRDHAGGADGSHPHLFHLADAAANVYPGGGLQGAQELNWPIIRGQHGAVYLARLAPGGVREPHWHPSAWELNFVLQGRARWTLVGPSGTQDTFEASKGDLAFAPQGHFHYFENASESEDVLVLIAFNSSSKEPDDDIGIVHSLKVMPPDVLAAVFGGKPEMFANLPGKLDRVLIASKTSD